MKGGGVMSALFSSKFSYTCHSGWHLGGSQEIFLGEKQCKNALYIWFCVIWEIIVVGEEINIGYKKVEAIREYNYNKILHKMGWHGTNKEYKRVIMEKEGKRDTHFWRGLKDCCRVCKWEIRNLDQLSPDSLALMKWEERRLRGVVRLVAEEKQKGKKWRRTSGKVSDGPGNSAEDGEHGGGCPKPLSSSVGREGGLWKAPWGISDSQVYIVKDWGSKHTYELVRRCRGWTLDIDWTGEKLCQEAVIMGSIKEQKDVDQSCEDWSLNFHRWSCSQWWLGSWSKQENR